MRIQFASSIASAIIRGGHQLEELIRPVAPYLALTDDSDFMASPKYSEILYELSKQFEKVFVVAKRPYSQFKPTNIHMLTNTSISFKDFHVIGGHFHLYADDPLKNYADRIFFENNAVAVSTTRIPLIIITDNIPSVDFVPSWVPFSIKVKMAVHMDPVIPYAKAWIYGRETCLVSTSGMYGAATLCGSNIATAPGYCSSLYYKLA